MNSFIVRSRAVIIDEEKLLLVRHTGGRNFYALPGGHLDVGENPQECIERELIEELGIRPKVGRLLYVYTYANKEGRHSVEFFFEIENSAEYLHHEEKEKTHAHEIDEVRWVTAKEEIYMLPNEFHNEFISGNVYDKNVRFLKGE